MPFVIFDRLRYGRRSRPALQEVQQRIAELTADVEENVGGVRVVKAFAREDRQLERFRAQRRAASSTSRWSRRAWRAFYNPFIGFLPQIGLAAMLFLGGRAVIDGSLDLGEFTAFYTYLLMLLGPMRTLGMLLGLAQRATASGARLFQILDREPQIVAHARRRAAAAGLRPRRAARRDARLRGRRASRALRDVDLDVAAGHDVALVGATGSGKTTLVALIPRLYDVDRRRGARRRRRRARRRPARAAPRDRRRRRRPVPVQRHASHENIAYARRATRRREEVERGRRARAGARLHRARCPTATTRASASAG